MQASIQTPTNKITNSHNFYQQLNYTLALFSEGRNIYSDGQVLIEINSDRSARAGINFYQADWSSVLEKRSSITIVEQKEGFLLCDPNGVFVQLKNGAIPDFSTTISPSTLGTFGGVSIETIDLSKSIQFWKLFGYEVIQGSLEKGWITLANKTGLDISLVKIGSCPHLFFNPGLNYFNGEKNLSIIQQIRDLGIVLTEEITHFNKEGIVDNIIIRDPGGLGFFIFND